MYEDRKKRIDRLAIIFAIVFFAITATAIFTLMKEVYTHHDYRPEAMLQYELMLAVISIFFGATIVFMLFKVKGRTIIKKEDISYVLHEKKILKEQVDALQDFGDLFAIDIEPDYSIFSLNSKAEELFKRVDPEFRHSLRSIISHDALSDQDIVAVFRGEKESHTFSMESWHLGDGHPRILRGIIKPVLDIDHEIVSAIILLIDLTDELKKELRITKLENELFSATLSGESRLKEALAANEKLRHSIRILSDTIIAAPTGLIVIDKDGIIRNCNRASENLFNFHESEMTGKSIDILFTNRTVTGDTLMKAEAGQNVEYEVDCLRSDLSHFVGKLMVKPVFDAKHNVLRYVLSIDDVTSRTKFNKYILLKNQELLSVNEIFMSTNQFNSLNKKLNVFLDRLFDNLEVVRKGLVYLKGSDGSLILNIYKGFHVHMLKELDRLSYENSLAGYSLRTNKVILSEQFDSADVPEVIDMLKKHNLSDSHVYLPITYKERLLGVLIIFPNKSYNFESSDFEFFNMIRGELGICIKQALKYEELKKRVGSSTEHTDISNT